MNKNFFFIFGAISAFLAVGLGAFGAHALKKILSSDLLIVWETGVKYQFYHALALLVTNLYWEKSPSKMRLASFFFVVGIFIFSGSLYTLCLSGVRYWGAVTPFGGVSFLLGWVVLIWSGIKR